MDNVSIHTRKKPMVSDAVDMYVSVGWGAHNQYDFKKFERAFEHSNFITAYENNELVGFIRFMTDHFHETNVSEFLVRPQFQRNGIGKKLLEKLYECYGHTDIYVNTPEGYENFFLKNGMKPQDSLLQVSRAAKAA